MAGIHLEIKILSRREIQSLQQKVDMNKWKIQTCRCGSYSKSRILLGGCWRVMGGRFPTLPSRWNPALDHGAYLLHVHVYLHIIRTNLYAWTPATLCAIRYTGELHVHVHIHVHVHVHVRYCTWNMLTTVSLRNCLPNQDIPTRITAVLICNHYLHVIGTHFIVYCMYTHLCMTHTPHSICNIHVHMYMYMYSRRQKSSHTITIVWCVTLLTLLKFR